MQINMGSILWILQKKMTIMNSKNVYIASVKVCTYFLVLFSFFFLLLFFFELEINKVSFKILVMMR